MMNWRQRDACPFNYRPLTLDGGIIIILHEWTPRFTWNLGDKKWSVRNVCPVSMTWRGDLNLLTELLGRTH